VQYEISPEGLTNGPVRDSILEQARIELGMKAFLEAGDFGAFTTTFEDLHGIKQLPGLAVQRLMEAGYGFGGEGDWKTAAFTRVMKNLQVEKGLPSWRTIRIILSLAMSWCLEHICLKFARQLLPAVPKLKFIVLA
jgi:L-arabinose isomerase